MARRRPETGKEPPGGRRACRVSRKCSGRVARRLAANLPETRRSEDRKDLYQPGRRERVHHLPAEEFRRQLKQREQRLKAQRQEEMDAAKLWYKERMGELRGRKRLPGRPGEAGAAPGRPGGRSLMIQDNEITWVGGRKRAPAGSLAAETGQRNAIALEVARQQRDEDIAILRRK